MRVRVTHDIDDLQHDLERIPAAMVREGGQVVRKTAREGNDLAKANARRTAGKHGRHYPNAFDVELKGALEAEYGPDASRPQGGMSFEFGSRNQPPHLDLAKSADVIGPKFAKAISDMVDDLFWAGGDQ